MTSGTQPRKQKPHHAKKYSWWSEKFFSWNLLYLKFLHKSTYVCAHTCTHTRTLSLWREEKRAKSMEHLWGASFLWGEKRCNGLRTTDWIEVNIIFYLSYLREGQKKIKFKDEIERLNRKFKCCKMYNWIYFSPLIVK